MEKASAKLQKLSLVCRIGSVVPTQSPTPQPVGGSKKAKGLVAPRLEGKSLVLSNEQTKTEFIKYVV